MLVILATMAIVGPLIDHSGKIVGIVTISKNLVVEKDQTCLLQSSSIDGIPVVIIIVVICFCFYNQNIKH